MDDYSKKIRENQSNGDKVRAIRKRKGIAKRITKDTPDWSGTASELVLMLDSDIPVNTITKRLNVNAGRLFNEYSIIYKRGRTHGGRKLELHFSAEKRDSP